MATSELQSIANQLNLDKMTAEQKRDAVLVSLGLIAAVTFVLSVVLVKTGALNQVR